MGSFYTPASLQAQLGKANVMVDLMGSPTDILNVATVSGNTISWTLSTTTGTFNQATGLLTWQVTNAAGKPLTIEAVYFDDQKIVGGLFHDGVSEARHRRNRAPITGLGPSPSPSLANRGRWGLFGLRGSGSSAEGAEKKSPTSLGTTSTG